jgi:hypothetical protein
MAYSRPTPTMPHRPQPAAAIPALPGGGVAALVSPVRRGPSRCDVSLRAITAGCALVFAAACSSVDSDSALGGLDAGLDAGGYEDSGGDGGGGDDFPMPPDTGDDGGGDGDGDESIPVDCNADEVTSHYVQSENRIGTRWVATAVRSMIDGDPIAPAGGPPTAQAVLDLYSFPHAVPAGSGLDVSTLVWRSPFATEDRWVFQLAVSSAADYERAPVDVVIAVGVSVDDGEKAIGRTSAVLADTLSLLAPGDRVTVLSGTTVKLLAHEASGPTDEILASALATAVSAVDEPEASVVDAAYELVSSDEYPEFAGHERRVLFVGRALATSYAAQLEEVAAAATGETPVRFFGVAVGDLTDPGAGFDELAASGGGRALYVTESQASPKRLAALRSGLFAAATDITIDVQLPPGLALAAPQWAEHNLPVAPPGIAGSGRDGLTPPLPGPSLLTLGVGETVVLQRTLVGCGSRLDAPTPMVVFADWKDGATTTPVASEFEFDLAQAGAGTEANASQGLRLHKGRIVVAFAELVGAWASGSTGIGPLAERTLALLDSIQPSLPEDTELNEIRAAVNALLVLEQEDF